MDTNKIEKALLDRELKNISEQLCKIGGEIQRVFSKYGTIEGKHSEELKAYIVEHVLNVDDCYYAGYYTTRPAVKGHPAHIPECIKKLVLDWAVADFFVKIGEIEDIVGNLPQE